MIIQAWRVIMASPWVGPLGLLWRYSAKSSGTSHAIDCRARREYGGWNSEGPLMKTLSLSLLACLSFIHAARAEQFLFFDEVFTFEEKDAVPTQSHLHVKPAQFGKDTPKDWTKPVDYRNGTVHIRFEVLEKPAGDVPTIWSLCYIPIKGQKNNYGCASSQVYTKAGVYEKDEKMNAFWENDSIIWTEGIREMTLVIK